MGLFLRGRVITLVYPFPPTFLSIPSHRIVEKPLSKAVPRRYPKPMPEEITLYESKWLGLYRIGHWDFARRPNSDACVGILAITDGGEVVLVEQFRIPVGRKVVELPAGLVGDEPEFRSESLAETAARELMEETGYRAGRIELVLTAPTSPGMTPEFTNLFHATGLSRETEGGGNASEDITVHHVPLSELRGFLAAKQSEGLAVDFKIHAALAAANIAF